MKEISLFDVIGPNMIGPSSSHTAGALRIANMAQKIVGKKITNVEFILYGSFAHTYKGHGTNYALVAGIMGLQSDDERIRTSFEMAKEEGLEYKYTIDKETVVHDPNTVVIKIKDGKDEWSITGVSLGGGEFKVTNINGVEVELTGEYATIMVKQKDLPGVVAHITNCLAQYKINIALMKLYREEKGKFAYTIVEIDEGMDRDVLEAIEKNPNIAFVTYIPK